MHLDMSTLDSLLALLIIPSPLYHILIEAQKTVRPSGIALADGFPFPYV
jgi:hypothetical protein